MDAHDPRVRGEARDRRHIFWHADAARFLRERLTEQEMRPKAIDAFRDAGIDRLIEEILSANSAAEFLVGIHQVAGRASPRRTAITATSRTR
ncbi:MAG: hypothetical protein IPN11_16230 [Opitutaceae bacterium]|nr:hypothetical protein [Opitutaceae bacterium]